MRFLGAFITGYDGKVVAPYSRFYLGGEDNLRGFDVRTVSPVVFIPQLTTTPIAYTNPTVLGASGSADDRHGQHSHTELSNSFPGWRHAGRCEPRVSNSGRAARERFAVRRCGSDRGAAARSIAAQFDRFHDTASSSSRTLPGVSSHAPIPARDEFQAPRSAGVELVVQLPIVQAPFRIYWAYNFERMAQIITAPTTQFPGTVNNMADPTRPPCTATLTTNCFDTRIGLRIRSWAAAGGVERRGDSANSEYCHQPAADEFLRSRPHIPVYGEPDVLMTVFDARPLHSWPVVVSKVRGCNRIAGVVRNRMSRYLGGQG